MREIPECLNRRYHVLDSLVKDLCAAIPPGGTITEHPSCANNEIGIKLMCDFWNILQDDPDCNLPQEVQQRLVVHDRDCTGMYGPQRLDCFMAGKDQNIDRRRDAAMDRIKHLLCVADESKTSKRYGCGANSTDNEKMPLRQVLCNLKEAASFDKKCNVRVSELVSVQRELTEQIQLLEERERQGVLLLKQADCMWSCMEDSYKKKVANAQERYNILLKELKEVEVSANKWRKNKKDLEFQLKNINQCNEDIKEKINQKKNDLKVLDIEIEDFKKRIASNNKDLDTAKSSYKSKKEASDARIANIATEMAKLQKKITAEYKCKAEKEQEGTNYVKEAREDLQKICRVLLQKKLENEDLRAEKDALLQEIDLLRKTCDTCKERCANREKSIADEMKRVELEIAGFKAKCVKCHQCTDTIDIRKYCTDCPRCLSERDCLYEDDHCSPDHTMDCVCMSVKQKFLDNVFDNMYTVLERQSKTCPGKAVADCILNCLKRSRNGKLNEETRKVLQDFILSTVKKNLNLTIVGGAVKTRCEMDPETYKQLMLCLKDVVVTRPVKEDKGTVAKKEPCRRWGGTSECNCPKGPKACICTKKAPPPPTDPTSCGPPQSEETDTSEKTCPQRESLACSTDCGMLGLPGAAAWKREPCAGQTCPFSKNMRAAQCVLGPEALASVQTHPTPPIIPNLPTVEKMAICTCGGKAVKSCPCHRDTKHLKAEVKDDCNKGTCANFRKITKDNHEHEVPLQDAAIEHVNFKPVSSVQKDILFSDQNQKKILEEYTKNDFSQNDTKEQFKVAIENEIGQSNQQFTELTQTKSGRLAIELDEQIIKKIEEKSKTDPYLFISIKKTSSGHVLVDFDTKENVADNTHRVAIRKTPSGTRLLDIHKNMISILKNTLSTKTPNSSLSKSIKLSSSPRRQESPIQVDTDKYLPSIDLKKTGNEKDEIVNKILQPHDIKTNNEKNVGLKCTCLKSTLDSVCCKLISETDLLMKNTTNATAANQFSPPKNNEKEELKCTCPKTTPDSVCCKLMSNTNLPVITDKYSKSIPGSTNIDKYLTSKQEKKEEELKSTCLKTVPGSVCCKLSSDTNLLLTDIKDTTTTYKCLPLNNKEKAEIKCTCSKTTPDLVCCKLSSDTDLPLTDIKGTVITNKHSSLKNKESEELKCTCTKTTFDSVCCKLISDTDLMLKNIKGTTITEKHESLKNKKKGGSECTCPKTKSNSICCKKTTELEGPQASQTTNSWKSANSRNVISMDEFDVRSEFKQLYKQGNANVVLKIQRKNGEVCKLPTVVTKTTSGTIAIYASGMQSFKEISFDGKESQSQCPVHLSKTVSGTYFVNLGNNDQTFNATLRKTPSGGMLFIPNTKSFQKKYRKVHKFEDFFKVKIIGMVNKPVELPAVLNTTPSENYIIVIDTESEKHYKETINKYIGEKRECNVNLYMSSSGNYIMEMDNGGKSNFVKNASLVKSLSDNIKILVHGPDFESIIQSASARSARSSILSEQAFAEIVSKLPASSREFHRGNLRKSKKLSQKASSDTQLFEKVKIKLQDNKRLLSEPSAVLKKTTSGQYAIVLNKESKKAFINNLQSYLTTNSEGLVPIKRTDSGEIIINLNNNDRAKAHNGSLKITPSGNIYVVVDEDVIKGMTKRSRKNEVLSSAVTLRSKNATQLIDSVNKAVATTCHARSDDCCCDASKCVCAELQFDAMHWPNEKPEKQFCPSIWQKIIVDTDNCNAKKYNGVAKPSAPGDKSPHIVIKPNCDCRSAPKNKFGSTEQCYYLLDSVCPYHQHRYDGVSNELLEISGLCKAQENQHKNKIEFEANNEVPSGRKVPQVWDSLNYLPPQLPPFLKNVSYR